jgi:hypothetical protein
MIHARKLIRLRERSNNFRYIKVCRTTSLTQTLSPRRGLSRSPRFVNISGEIGRTIYQMLKTQRWLLPLLGERAGVREGVTQKSAGYPNGIK